MYAMPFFPLCSLILGIALYLHVEAVKTSIPVTTGLDGFCKLCEAVK